MGSFSRRHQIVLIFVFTILTALVSACGSSQQNQNSIGQIVPDAPGNTDFGPLYPRINAYLTPQNPDVISAIRDVRDWAAVNLDGFSDGVCAQTQVVTDAEFARAFGRTTLGVTLPWMQIYIRDGHRDEASYLWKDASLLASTVIHEYVHSIQRVRQARQMLNAGATCNEARATLLVRRGIWNAAFEDLRTNVQIDDRSYPAAERSLVYRWASPIERAKDEVEAAAMTVKWMSERPTELNVMTIGGANNWAYAVQYLNQLKILSTTNCFSPDNSTFEEEKQIYNDLPQYAHIISTHESAMRKFLRDLGMSSALPPVDEVAMAPSPMGRSGAHCSSAAALELPSFPVNVHFPSSEASTLPGIVSTSDNLVH